MAIENSLRAIKYARGSLEVLDQTKLPHEFVYDKISTCEEAFACIREMRVRGAPAIAIVAALALAVEIVNRTDIVDEQMASHIENRLNYLKKSRPTAVDLANAVTVLKKAISLPNSFPGATRQSYIEAAEKILEADLETNLSIGRYGVEYLRAYTNEKMSILTHCNTGSLATSGHGTALGIIRTLHENGHLKHAFCTETRPYNQGSRLTAFELVHEKIPSTLITDSMAGALFLRKKNEMNITAVIVGADRVARNGDTANKIGTYSLAVLANVHKILFIVSAPTTSIDLKTRSGATIEIEDRAKSELTQIKGAVVGSDGEVDVTRSERVATADQRIDVWNPAFDVTPYVLIDAIITERGIVVKGDDKKFSFREVMPEQWAELVPTDAGEGISMCDESNGVITSDALTKVGSTVAEGISNMSAHA